MNPEDPKPSASDAWIERAGMMIGPYKLLEKVGEGGFGLVYMAEQLEPVQRKVALKIVKLGMDTREVVARFEAERQALAMMEHPNIARVFDGGTTEAGRPYFAMELVRGIPITDYCDHANLPTPERLRLFMKVCHAVQHAHQKGIIHRDLKPRNVLVTLHDGVAVPKVIDFGVAKALGQRLTDKTLFTGFARMIGTPAYMSPEQAELSGLDVDTRSDIYSLGVLLYELLTGMTPFDLETLNEDALDEIRRIIRETEPPKPSTRLQTLGENLTEIARRRRTEPHALGRLVRGDLDWMVMKCLEKNRQRRYETAGELAQDVERHLNFQPVLARPPGNAYRMAKFVRRNRVGVSFAAVLALAFLLGLGSTLLALKRVHQEQAHAEAAATIATTINDFVQSTMMDTLGEHAGTNASLVTRGVLDQLAGKVPQQFAGRPLVEAAVRLALGRTYVSLGNYPVAEQQVQLAVDIRRREFGAEHPDTLEALGALGFLRFKQGKPAEAEALLREVLKGQREVLHESDPALMQTLMMLQDTKSPGGAASLAPDLLKAVRSLRKDDPAALRALHSVVDKLRSDRRLLEAETLGRELLARREGVLGSNRTETVQAMLCLSYTLEGLNRNLDAEQLRREALKRARQTKPTSQYALTAFKGLLDLVMQKQDYEEADRLLGEELKIETRVLGPGHPRTLATKESLTKVSQQRTSSVAARLERRQRVATAEERIRLDIRDGGAWLERALVRADLKLWNLAVADFDQALLRTNFANAGKAADYAGACLALARGAFRGEQHDLATRASRQAVQMFSALEQKYPQAPNYAKSTGQTLWELSDACVAVGRRDEAKRALDEALRVFEGGAVRCPQAADLRQEQGFSHRKIALFYESEGDTDQAEKHLRSAAQVYSALKKEFPDSSWYMREEAYTVWLLAEILRKTGLWEEAEDVFREAVSLHETATAKFPSEPEFNSRLGKIRGDLASLLEAESKSTRPLRPDQPVPPRPVNATSAMVDLTSHFNAVLNDTWHPGAPGNDLARLPLGIQTFQGIPFDVRGIVQLYGGGMIGTNAKPYPQRVLDIKIGRRCTRLHFLHSAGWKASEGNVVGCYLLHYADGSRQALPIVYGRDLRDWWVGTAKSAELKQGRIAWQGQTTNGNDVRVYRRTWDNPHPDREVATLEFISSMTDCAPFLLAITTE